MKKIHVIAISTMLLSFTACSTVGSVLYDQREVDASGPAPEWVKGPEKARRIALEGGNHLFIGHASGSKIVGLKDQSCGSAVEQARESGFTLKNPVGEVYWSRTRGEIGDKFHYFCKIETGRSK